MSKKVVCYGEMLWDCFPEHEIPGGAPMNVALHLCQLGLDVQMISRIGLDAHGEKLLDFTSSFGLDPTCIQKDEIHPTGKVIVDNKDPENIKYDIVSPAAWDYIALTNEALKAVKGADAFIFGSLSVRNQVSWETLYHLLHEPVLKIFDINLRAPFYDFEQIEIILGYTDILKINEHELLIVADYFDIDLPEKSTHLEKSKMVCAYLTEHFPISMVCITLGDKGAMIYQEGNITSHPGYSVKVEDTVGSGDAFLSGFVKTYLEGKRPQDILDFACAMGAYVATQKGGTPRYEIEDVLRVKEAAK
ncbi:carbohydrate kinase family protein [Cecembia calidifontis]|jgi:fructokinase|uniref:Fructokinase n=1 Tax=Cecembia calidifontis TaxID=1187080 RepID=A0A4Q7P9T5_9BACT|nr:carbohydrate kinase [Cecembia calidifontis]RZS96677.1 fructokinase [Cecembia calidifontis]